LRCGWLIEEQKSEGFDIMSDDVQKKTGRDALGRFAKGNPGRPLGAKNKTPRAVLNQIHAMDNMALQMLWQAVNSREKWAIEYVLSRILPANRTIEFEGISAEDIIVALTAGDISPDEGKSLAGTLRNLRELENMDEIVNRLDSLELLLRNR